MFYSNFQMREDFMQNKVVRTTEMNRRTYPPVANDDICMCIYCRVIEVTLRFNMSCSYICVSVYGCICVRTHTHTSTYTLDHLTVDDEPHSAVNKMLWEPIESTFFIQDIHTAFSNGCDCNKFNWCSNWGFHT